MQHGQPKKGEGAAGREREGTKRDGERGILVPDWEQQKVATLNPSEFLWAGTPLKQRIL